MKKLFNRSPANTRHNLRLDHEFYNLTMTYRLDSDILWSYRKIIEKSSGNVVAPSQNVKWKQPDDNFIGNF
jgi:alpha-1,3-fucosyltransferase